MTLEEEILHCRNCRLWNDGVGFDPEQTFQVWPLKNGMTLSVPGAGAIPLWSEYVPCAEHEAKLQARQKLGK